MSAGRSNRGSSRLASENATVTPNGPDQSLQQWRTNSVRACGFDHVHFLTALLKSANRRVRFLVRQLHVRTNGNEIFRPSITKGVIDYEWQNRRS